MKNTNTRKTILRTLPPLLAILALSSAAQAQGIGSVHEIRDSDWDYWTNPGVLCPVDLDDRVGVGTNLPGSELEVCTQNFGGGLRVSWGDAYPTLFSEIGYPQTGGLVINSRSGGSWADISLQTDGTPRLFVDSGGYVGVGTTSPQRELEIFDSRAYLRVTSNDAQGSVLELKSTSTTGGTWRGRINFLDQNNVAKAEISYYDLELLDDPGLRFVTDNTTRMMINKNTGNIGIGTTSPMGSLWTDSRTLEIQGSAPSIVLDDMYGSAKDDFEISNGGAVVLFRDATDGVDVMCMGLTGALQGRVGIGTNNPQGKLDVNGSIYQRGGLLHADYVFEDAYELESIEEHAAFMWDNKHLKAIPKARADENGLEVIEVGSHRRGIVEELEKAHIYIDRLHQHIGNLDAQLEAMNERLEKLEGCGE